MKADGYIFTPELLQWKLFRRPVVVQVLLHVLLSATHNEASAATLSYRDLATQLGSTVKAIRVAVDTLVAEKIITKCSAPRASTKLYINSSHPLAHCILPWQRDLGAQIGAQSRAQSRAQTQHPQVIETQGCRVYYQGDEGTDWGTDGAQFRAQQKRGAQRRAQARAQISHSETPLNKGDSEDLNKSKGTDKDTAKGTLAREGKKEKKETKENLSPTPPIKEKKEKKERRQERAHTQTQKKEKEKKPMDAETQFAEVLRLFNRLFLGTRVKPISKMTPDRKKMVAKFISDYSFEEVETMLRKALDSDLLSGRKDGASHISFNWLFNPENYEQLMEGTFDNPTVAASAGSRRKVPSPPPAPPQPQHEETADEIEARLKRKAEREKEEEQQQTKALREKYLGWIEAAKNNPHGSMAKMVRQAYENGSLAELGIVWNPSVAEEDQSLADLDDQTQSYLQSIING